MKTIALLLLLFSFQMQGQDNRYLEGTLMDSLNDADLLFPKLDLKKEMSSTVINVGGCCNFSCFGPEVIETYKAEYISIKKIPVLKGYSVIEGHIVDNTSSEPLLFASVALYQNDVLIIETETNLDGSFSLEGLSCGVYQLEISYAGYQSKEQDINLDNYASVEMSMDEKTCLRSRVFVAWGLFKLDSEELDFEEEKQKPYSPASFLLYPNPASDMVNLSLSEDVERLIITSEIGQLILQQENILKGEYPISVSSFEAGSYFLTTVKNGVRQTRSFMVIK